MVITFGNVTLTSMSRVTITDIKWPGMPTLETNEFTSPIMSGSVVTGYRLKPFDISIVIRYRGASRDPDALLQAFKDDVVNGLVRRGRNANWDAIDTLVIGGRTYDDVVFAGVSNMEMMGNYVNATLKFHVTRPLWRGNGLNKTLQIGSGYGASGEQVYLTRYPDAVMPYDVQAVIEGYATPDANGLFGLKFATQSGGEQLLEIPLATATTITIDTAARTIVTYSGDPVLPTLDSEWPETLAGCEQSDVRTNFWIQVADDSLAMSFNGRIQVKEWFL